jgi:hypothetical protein
MVLHILLLVPAATSSAQPPGDRRPIGEIEFFGYKGLDIERVRAALPVHEGDLFPAGNSSEDPAVAIRRRIQEVLGRDATDVQFICCADRQNWMIYIGLPGETSRGVAFNREPTGASRLPAAVTLSHARASVPQVDALVEAAFDVDGRVRSNAVRALDVLFTARADLATRVRVDRFVALLTSGQWTDHNNGILLVEPLTRGRNPDVLSTIGAAALENLVEMARWRNKAHAGAARFVLGRAAGIDEARLQELVQRGPIDAIINAALAH